MHKLMRKTVKEWFESVADYDLRCKLIENTSLDTLDLTSMSLREAIKIAFPWYLSPEGSEYWFTIYNQALHGFIQTVEAQIVYAEDIYEDLVELMLADAVDEGWSRAVTMFTKSERIKSRYSNSKQPKVWLNR